MAYYDALVTKWATLSSGLTTAQKLTAINSATVTGSVPTSFYTSGDQLLNCISWPEFTVLGSSQQSNLLSLCHTPGQILGGSGNLSHMAPGMIVAYFPSSGATIASLVALAQAVVTPWWQASVANGGGGLASPVNNNDLLQAGGLT